MEEPFMIFISGIHGVGKSFFCTRLRATTGIETYTSSKLIEQAKKVSFAADKKINDIDDNQKHLLAAITVLKGKNKFFVLDGHFCLLSKDGCIVRISKQTFIDLQPEAIVLITEQPAVIAERRMERDGIEIDMMQTQRFQEAEIAYAQEVAEELEISLKVSKGAGDLLDTIDFIKKRRR
jgi:adenylate kinase